MSARMSTRRRLKSVATWLLILAAPTLCTSQAAKALPQLYIVTDQPKLITVDPETQVTTIIGDTSLSGTNIELWDIAFSPSGDLYGISLDSLYRVNANTGALSLIGSLGGPKVNALIFSDSGVLYAAGGNTMSWNDGVRTLYTINTTTGQATSVGTSTFNSSGDLAFLNGDLYITSVGSTTNELFSVNPTNAAASMIGPVNVPFVFGLGAHNNTLYGVSYDKNILTINTTTGAGTTLFNYPGKVNNISTGGANGMAIRLQASVPPAGTPGPLPIAGTAAALALSRRLRSRLRLRDHQAQTGA